MQKIWTIGYAVTAAAFLSTIPFTPYDGSFAVKVLPILLLLGLALRSPAFTGKWGLVAAVVFSGCGDVVLDLQFKNSFIAGLASFLVAHLCYIGVFARRFRPQPRWAVITLGGILYPAAMAAFLWPYLGNIQIPVLVYIAAIALMFLTAINRHEVNLWLVFGAGFFVLSDSILALNRFYAPISGARYAIMVTYYLAQFLIVTALVSEAEQAG